MPSALPGTRIQRKLMNVANALGVTHDSFAAHLGDVWGRNVDRSLVSRWAGGSRAMPVGAAVELARHAAVEADKVEAEVAERVLSPLARALDCVVVRLPEAACGTGLVSGLTSRALGLGSLVGELQAMVCDAVEDETLDDEERDKLARQIDEAVKALSKLRAEVTGKPVAVLNNTSEAA